MKKLTQKKAKELISLFLSRAKVLIEVGDYKGASKIYADISRFVLNWKQNTIKETDDTRRQERERDNKNSGSKTESES
jgi:hypothetical protein